jgi:hypothetical protein
MGIWSVLSVAQRHTMLNNATNIGINYYVTFRLQYSKAGSSKFVEPPKMAWDEIILYNDHAAKTRWEFRGNMYTHKPDSPTVAVWAQRYFRAYFHAHGQEAPFSNAKGHSKLFDLKGTPVTGATLGKSPPGNLRELPGQEQNIIFGKQNAAVQEYLKKNGGILEIEVHDIPSILKPTNTGKAKSIERLLTFNCGVTGTGPRVQAWLYSKVDSGKPEREWINRFNNDGNPPGVKTTGLALLPPGTPGAGISSSDLLPSGGIW